VPSDDGKWQYDYVINSNLSFMKFGGTISSYGSKGNMFLSLKNLEKLERFHTFLLIPFFNKEQ
jgi:hypothetical protein